MLSDEGFAPSPRRETLAFQKMDGLVALELPKVILDGDLTAGDDVTLFRLPDGRFLISKETPSETTYKIRKISSAYVYFDTEIVITEV